MIRRNRVSVYFQSSYLQGEAGVFQSTWFVSLEDARIDSEECRNKYTTHRPRYAPGYRSPKEFLIENKYSSRQWIEYEIYVRWQKCSLFWIGFLWSGHTYLKGRNIMIVEVLNPLKKCGRMFAFFMYTHFSSQYPTHRQIPFKSITG